MEKHIVLIGMMGSGKSTVGRELSKILGLPFVDTDTLIEEKEGMSISDIFRERGEPYFRRIESEVLCKTLSERPSILATGGGIILSEQNRKLIKEKAIPVFLYADTDLLAERLKSAEDRPLLQGNDLRKRLGVIWDKRKVFYEEYENRIDTKGLTPREIAIEIIIRFLPYEVNSVDEGIISGRGVTKHLKEVFREKRFQEPILIITSSFLWNRWKKYVIDSLGHTKYESFFLPDGETAKSMEYVEKIWEKMFSLGFTRRNPVLLLGGGTIGDAAGFAASTFMRGVPLLQIPTTLLSQVDSSIGGKRGVNYKHLKNMIGTFYDAVLTVLDPIFLLTLPEREIRGGLSEAIKSAIIGDPLLFKLIETHIPEIFSYNLRVLGDIIERTVKVKLDVVKQDPYETKGYRKVLNLGHTLGHALEGYDDFSITHGEAVAIGMTFASFLGEKKGITPDPVRKRIEKILKDAGLPVSFPERLTGKAIKKMYHDKKREDEKLFWVVPEKIGRVGFYKFSGNEIEEIIRLFCKEYTYETKV